METTDNDVSGRPPAGGRVEAAAETPPSDAGQPAAVAALGVIVANDRDLRSLTWLREQVGDTAIAAAVAQLAGQRRPYVSNVAKALGIAIPSDLALTGADTARARLASLRALIKKK
ncbi:cryptic plasmid protein A [Ralstonia pseudosolanacearum]|uniref:cryptic plasmid protein A n=1 Tax=Ralstonia pseudosolanacearum TaxID=1310165 RepID=UPI004053A3EB